MKRQARAKSDGYLYKINKTVEGDATALLCCPYQFICIQYGC